MFSTNFGSLTFFIQKYLISLYSNEKSGDNANENSDCTLEDAQDTNHSAVARDQQPESTSLSLSALSEPFQPKEYTFPVRIFGKDKAGKELKRSFQTSWFSKYKWLHYEAKEDAAFCFVCIKATAENMVTCTKAEKVFTEQGFINWKKALEKGKGFDKHEQSEAHKDATDRYIVIPKTTGDIGEIISESHSKEKYRNRQILLKILETIKFLGRQSLPFRGNWDKDSKCEENSNFYQLLKLRCGADFDLEDWFNRKQRKYTSPEIQNEIIKIMALNIQRQISAKIQDAVYYSIMADETDVSNKEQIVICIRWVDNNLVAHEDFIGLHPLHRTDANTITNLLKDILLRLNLCIDNARGQCYDGAAAMAGAKSGVATRFKEMNEKCLYTHCYGHALNLAVGDSIKKVSCLSDTFCAASEICKLVKKSLQRNTKLHELRETSANSAKSVHAFCPRRWTVRGEVLESIVENHDELMDLWDWSLSVVKDTEMKGRIIGAKSNMTSFEFLFGCSLGKLILKQTDNLSRTLQDPTLSAAQGQSVAKDVVTTLEKDRNNESFELFWRRLKLKREALEIQAPKLPRKRKMPDWFGTEGNPVNTHHFPDSPKDRYRQFYYQAFDYTIQSIKSRFSQTDYKKYSLLQQLLLKAANGDDWAEEFQSVCSFYTTDFKKSLLSSQLEILPASLRVENAISITELIAKFQSLDPARKVLLSEVLKVFKILLVMPATNAVSERSFSALKRVKTYLRATTTDNRFNNLIVLHIHKHFTDNLDMVAVANEFCGNKVERKERFGIFSKNDIISERKEFRDTSTQT